jgi:hypothetical protein
MTEAAMTPHDWEEELGTLLVLRATVQNSKDAQKRAWDAVIASKEYQWWLTQTEHRKLVEAEQDGYESVLRFAAVEEYQRHGDKNIAPGLTVRMKNVLDYDDVDALRYCKAGLDAAVTFDRKVLEKVLFSMDADILPSFVVRSQEPTCTIATDLAKALDGPA